MENETTETKIEKPKRGRPKKQVIDIVDVKTQHIVSKASELHKKRTAKPKVTEEWYELAGDKVQHCVRVGAGVYRRFAFNKRKNPQQYKMLVSQNMIRVK